jgi:hypothetical protein
VGQAKNGGPSPGWSEPAVCPVLLRPGEEGEEMKVIIDQDEATLLSLSDNGAGWAEEDKVVEMDPRKYRALKKRYDHLEKIFWRLQKELYQILHPGTE